MRSPIRLVALGAALALLACSDSAPPPAPSPATPSPAPAAAQPAASAPAAVASVPDAARGKLQFESYRGRVMARAAKATDLPAWRSDRARLIGDRAYMSAKIDAYLFDVIKNGGAPSAAAADGALGRMLGRADPRCDRLRPQSQH